MPRSDFLHEATERGFVFQCTDTEALDAALNAPGPVAGYIGFDATADSLHVGSLVQIMLLRLLQRTGNKPVTLMGGGTSRIGDPSFRDDARQLLKDEQIASNLAGIRRCFDPFIRFEDDGLDTTAIEAKLKVKENQSARPAYRDANGKLRFGAIMPNNADWLDKLGYIELLREIGPHFSISRMLSFDSVKSRLEREQGLTFLEFNYSILQSYDFRELNRRHGVTLQMGGSDQWGNIVSGIDLVRRTDSKQVFGLTTPLIATASGAKMGKSAQGAVWLTADKLPAFDYWQFWRNTEDADTGRFLRLFTDLPLAEIARLEQLGGAEINEAKKILATEATTLAHGAVAAAQAAEAARNLYETGAGSIDIPTATIATADIGDALPAFRLVTLAGLAASNAEARRLIRGGGVRLNDTVVTEENHPIAAGQLADGIKLSVGRKLHRLVRSA